MVDLLEVSWWFAGGVAEVLVVAIKLGETVLSVMFIFVCINILFKEPISVCVS